MTTHQAYDQPRPSAGDDHDAGEFRLGDDERLMDLVALVFDRDLAQRCADGRAREAVIDAARRALFTDWVRCWAESLLRHWDRPDCLDAYRPDWWIPTVLRSDG